MDITVRKIAGITLGLQQLDNPSDRDKRHDQEDYTTNGQSGYN